MKAAVPTALGGNGGVHLPPKEFHNAVLRAGTHDTDTGRKQVLIDTRNHYETVIIIIIISVIII